MGKSKTGRPIDTPIGTGLNVTGQDFERRAPIIPPGTISYIYSGQFRTTTKTASFTLSTEMVVLVDSTACSITLTLPAASSNTHKVYCIKKVDATGNSVTIKGNTSVETIDGEIDIALTLQYQYVMIICDGSDWYIIGGEYVKIEAILEDTQNEQIDLLRHILTEMRQSKLHLASLSGENISEKDAED